MARYLVTGSAGFIGFHLSSKLLAAGNEVVGLDNLNDYYSPQLKLDRNRILVGNKNYSFHEGDIADQKQVEKILNCDSGFESVFHLAAQAGVRYCLENPRIYIKSNIDGTLNILEAVRSIQEKTGASPHLQIASSSSVYGLSEALPFSETDSADRPVALYGATKRANELMAHSYSHLFGIRCTLLRFFTVYGPWGRPDMALFLFTQAILKGAPLEVFNGGDMVRDFTFVDDIVDGILGLDQGRKSNSQPLYDIYNIGNGNPRPLMEFIRAIENSTGKQAQINKLPFQPGDIQKTAANVTKLKALTSYSPKTQVEEGVSKFVSWYREYYQV